MFGIIIDWYWNGGEDPVTVSAIGSVDELKALDCVDPTNAVDNWPRAGVYPISALQIRNCASDDGFLPAHICCRPDE